MRTMSSDALARLDASGAARRDVSVTQLDTYLLVCGILSAVLYPAADVLASRRYPGFSYTDQAVSELFAIGAPTSAFIVRLFTISTVLLLPFAWGIWRSASGRRVVRALAILLVLHAVDALLLWNFFPMHMRGVAQTATDLMHGLLAIDPFLLAVLVLGAVAFPGQFRLYTIATILFGFVLAGFAMTFLNAVVAGQATPGMGLAERAAHYANNLWFIVLATMLLRHRGWGGMAGPTVK